MNYIQNAIQEFEKKNNLVLTKAEKELFQSAFETGMQLRGKLVYRWKNTNDGSGLDLCKICGETAYHCKCDLPSYVLPEEIEKAKNNLHKS